jgi:hypothetical protein
MAELMRARIKRLARKTICFANSIEPNDIVIGLFVNCYEFGLPVGLQEIQIYNATQPMTEQHLPTSIP